MNRKKTKIGDPLTDRQEAILDFIKDYFCDNQCTPTYRAIGEEFGIMSPNGVVSNLQAIEKKGYIEIRKKESRAIRIVSQGKCVLCGEPTKTRRKNANRKRRQGG